VLDRQKVCRGLALAWFDYLRDWDRTLRAGNYPQTTRYNYLLAVAQLDRYRLDETAAPERAVIATDWGMKYLPWESATGKMRAMAGAAEVLRRG